MRLADAPSLANPDVRLWRTSHTGGHRFAPTAIALPSASLWAWADAALLAQVVDGKVPSAWRSPGTEVVRPSARPPSRRSRKPSYRKLDGSC